MTFFLVKTDACKWKVSLFTNLSKTCHKIFNDNTSLSVNILWSSTCIVHSLSQTKCYCVFPILPSADNSNVRTVKTEGPSLVKPCIFDGQLKSISSERSDCSGQSSKRQEDTPMEVSSNPPPTDVFKVVYQSFSRKRHQNIYFRIADGNILVPLFS